MKTISKIVLPVTILMLTASCKKGTDPGIQTNMLQASIDGQTMQSNETSSLLVNGTLQVNGKNEEGQSLTLTVQIYKGPGFYYLSASDHNEAVYKKDRTSYTAVNGVIKITRDDAKLLQGNFYFETGTAPGAPEIENGIFSFSK